MLITLVFSSIVFTIFGSGELQPWDNSATSTEKKIGEVKENNNNQDDRFKVPVIKKSFTM